MRAIPEELCSLADACLTSSQELADGWTAAQGPIILDSRDAGNTQGGSDVVAAHLDASDAAGIAIGRLVSVLEQDMDDLYLCAFDFSATDEDAAKKLESTYSPPATPTPTPQFPPSPSNPSPSPTPSPEPGPAPTPPPAPAPTPTPTR